MDEGGRVHICRGEWSGVLGCLVLLMVAVAPPGFAQASSGAVFVPGAVTSFHSLPSGILIEAGSAREQIVALSEDVIRIRFSRTQTLPEDASWAVLAGARESRVPVTPVESDSVVGFATKALRVAVDRRTLELTVSDTAGHLVQRDAAPIEFHGDSFRIRKAMAADEHFFGLGDKTGPLDRREQAFTLWNTDAYRFQESTDPLYKSIPFFMTFRAGLASGVLLDNTWRSSFDFGKESRDYYS